MNYFLRQSRARLLSGLRYVVRRELVSPGNILVKPGDRVERTQVIAKCDMPGQKDVFRLARILGIRESRVEKYVQKKVNDKVTLGETLAVHRTLSGKRVFRSPVDGHLAKIDAKRGEIIIQRPSIDYSLEAGFEGEVSEVIGNTGVDIRIIADVFVGVMGIGKPSVGPVDILNEGQEDLEEKHIDGGSCDSILISGGSISYGVIKRAMAMGVRAIIAASIPARDFIEYNQREWGGELPEEPSRSIGIILTEGFGKHKMRLDFLEFFHALKRQTVVLDSIPGITGLAAIVPLGAERMTFNQSSHLRKDVVKMKKQQKARIIAGEQYGLTGRILAASFVKGEKMLGQDIDLVRIKLDRGDEVVAPRWNVEVLEG